MEAVVTGLMLNLSTPESLCWNQAHGELGTNSAEALPTNRLLFQLPGEGMILGSAVGPLWTINAYS